jgi:hypothetical protein
MSDIAATIDTYLAAWSETNPGKRAELVEQVWSDNGRLVDPPMAAEGRTGISDMFGVLQGQFPGHRFERASEIDAHHEQFRFAWQLVSPTGDVVLQGMDVGEFDEEGRLKRITGFFGDLPSKDA